MFRLGRRSLTALALSAVCFLLTAPPAPAGFEPDPNAPRIEIPPEFQWQTAHIFDSVAAWEEALAAVEAELPGISAYEGRLGESAETLYEFLQLQQDLGYRLRMLYSFANLNFDVDQSDDEANARLGRIRALFPRVGAALAFAEPEVLAVDPAIIYGYMDAHEDLAIYRFAYEELLRGKDFTLSEPEEQILALSGNVRGVPSNAHQSLLNVDLDFPEIKNEDGEMVPLTVSGFTRYRASTDEAVRQQAADAFFSTLRSYENTLATLLDGVVKSHLMIKDTRGYESCLEASLYGDHIDTEVYTNLIETINANLERTLHKYIALRKKVMGLDGPVTFPNLYNPLLADFELEFSYDEGRELVMKGLKPLGKEYLTYLAEGMDPASGWTDVYPNANKDSGAYSNGSLARTIHPFVKQNYDNTLDAVFTLAHEYGHALHSVYSHQTQPPVYGGYTTFLAEIASTCNEALLTNYMLRKAKSDEEKLYLLNQRLENIRLTIFRQTLFAEFELRAHEHAEAGNSLTAQFLNGLYRDLIQTYYGPDFEMGADDECEWMFIPHFYYNFYVFSYATGLTSGISLASQIDKKGEKVARRFIDNMLKAGSSAPPLDILASAGVDLRTPQPILDMLDMFEDTVKEFDKIWTEASR